MRSFVNSAEEVPARSLKLFPLLEGIPSAAPLLGRTSLSEPSVPQLPLLACSMPLGRAAALSLPSIWLLLRI